MHQKIPQVAVLNGLVLQLARMDADLQVGFADIEKLVAFGRSRPWASPHTLAPPHLAMTANSH